MLSIRKSKLERENENHGRNIRRKDFWTVESVWSHTTRTCCKGRCNGGLDVKIHQRRTFPARPDSRKHCCSASHYPGVPFKSGSRGRFRTCLLPDTASNCTQCKELDKKAKGRPGYSFDRGWLNYHRKEASKLARAINRWAVWCRKEVRHRDVRRVWDWLLPYWSVPDRREAVLCTPPLFRP